MTPQSRPPLVAVEIPQLGDDRLKHWAKLVSAVDSTRSSGWAFTGAFVATGGLQDVPAGSVLLVYGERGSRANPQVEARAYVVNPDATLTLHASAKGRAWARTLRDPVERLLSEPPTTHLDWLPELAAFSDEALAAELAARGWTVQQPAEEAT